MTTIILTWSAMVLLVYTYAGYPVLLWLISRLKDPLTTERGTTNSWPSLTVVISAYNEEAVIARRIQNLLDQDYPSEQVEILIGSDGSSGGGKRHGRRPAVVRSHRRGRRRTFLLASSPTKMKSTAGPWASRSQQTGRCWSPTNRRTLCGG